MSPQDSTTGPRIEADEDAFDDIQRLLDEAAAHAHAGAEVPPTARLRPAKAAYVKAMRPVTSFQRVYNDKILLAISRLKDHFETIARNEYGTPAQLDRLNVSIATLEVALDQVDERVRSIDRRFAAVDERIAVIDERIATVEERTAALEGRDTDLELRGDLETFESRLKLLEAKQNVLFREARMGLGSEPDIEKMRTLATELDDGDARMYADMEDLFRGSRDTVRGLLSVYLDDIASVPGGGTVVDIGCGRGEWLEILGEHEIDAYGLDLNAVTVAECTERGLDVRLEDAVAHLRALPESSLRAVTGFHIAEHLSLDGLLSVIESALVALRPGGVLILETPNCTNLSVGAASFYLDPTHVKPLHPLLLEFLCQHRGFTDVEIRYLHPRRETPAGDDVDEIERETHWSLFGPMDYAAIATKDVGTTSDPA